MTKEIFPFPLLDSTVVTVTKDGLKAERKKVDPHSSPVKEQQG